MSQHQRRNQRGTNLPKTSAARKNATKQSPDSSLPSTLKELNFSNSELKSPRFESTTPVTNATMNIPDGLNLNSQAPMSMEHLLKDIGTSDESEPEPDEKPRKQDRFSRLEEGFTEHFTGIGVLICAFHQDDGMVVVTRANPLSKRLVAVARQNPAVYKALKKYLDGSAYMMLAEEVATIGLAILANHGINPVAMLLDKMRKKDSQADGVDQLSAVA